MKCPELDNMEIERAECGWMCKQYRLAAFALGFGTASLLFSVVALIVHFAF